MNSGITSYNSQASDTLRYSCTAVTSHCCDCCLPVRTGNADAESGVSYEALYRV